MKNFLVGLLIMWAGAALMIWAYPLVEFFGRSDWAEKNLWGTRNMFVLIGFVLIIVGGLVAFGVVQMWSGEIANSETMFQ